VTNNQFQETNWFDQKISKTAGKLHIAYNPVKKNIQSKSFYTLPIRPSGGVSRQGQR
jgi:hypothetical protein